MTHAERMVVRAVGRLYRSQPGVVRFQMKRRKGRVLSCGDDCYRWYRESWMTEMLNAYRVMLRSKRRGST
jgi:hypothetical protein